MKMALISVAWVILVSGTALTREIDVNPNVPLHGARAFAEHRAVRLESGARNGCSTLYVTTTRSDGLSVTRKSVNCEE
jgi:hypothetical protein